MPIQYLNTAKIINYNNWQGGISDYEKNNSEDQFAHGRSIDYRTDPHKLQLLPKTTKESGSIVTDLIKDGDIVSTDLYLYDNAGNIYKRTSAGSHSLLKTVSSSHGNGMKYYTEDDFLYYTSDKLIGRYGQISGTSTFVDDFLGSEGGVPLNTNSLDLEAGSSQYASRADTASLSITGDLSIECSIKPESLPTAGNSMVLFSKWDVNTNLRSYKFEIYAVSGYFGDGSDGALTISSNTTEAPIDSACTGTSGAYALSATNASFAAGQIILIHQSRGTGAGTWQRNTISSYTAGTITLESALNATYSSGAQVRVLKQYTNVTIDSGKTYTAKAWDGTVGGILAFLANGTVTVTGTITASEKGYRGGTGGNNASGQQGEGTAGAGGTVSTAANGNGGGGGVGGIHFGGGVGGSGGNATAGTSGNTGGTSGLPGTPGSSSGSNDLTTMTFGGAGGGGGSYYSSGDGGEGGNGGGIIFISGATITVSNAITANGGNGTNGLAGDAGGGGGGAGGSILLKGQTVTLGSSITATGGTGGSPSGSGSGTVGSASTGRIHLDYYTSYTGSTTPTIDVTQDNNLVTNTTYQLRLALSSNGTAEEFLTKASTITTGTWYHVGVSWDASDAQAEFFQDGVSLGSSTGAVTSLNDNASKAAIGCAFNNTTPTSLYDGKIDEVRVWNTERTVTQIFNNKGVEIATNSSGLVAYYQLDGNADDSTANANHLTASGSPSYSTDVPFSSPTTRVDLDQSLDTSGNTYALQTSISETATHRQTFVPQKDPQKSIEVNISDTGDDSDWTLTVHDSLNRTVASKTYTHAQLSTGDFEFEFDTPWTPIRGASYHFHITATTTTGTPLVVSTSSNDLETADFHTYYQFLKEDTNYHPIEQMLNFLVIGNDRYVAKYDAASGYDPHKLSLPSGWKVRCFTKWREYLAIGCWKGTNIYDTDQGIIFFWDGISTTYNFYIEVPEGGINAMLSTKGILYVWAGYHGDMLEYRGGDSARVIKRVPKISDSEYIEIYPRAVSMWDSLLRWGVAGTSDAVNVERGIYTWGRRKESVPESLSFDYPISTGVVNSNVKIGFLMPVAKKLIIGWQDNVSYGVDSIDLSASPFTTGTIEQGRIDFGKVYHEKKALVVRADFEPLASGESIRVKYKLDDDTDWTMSDYEDTANETKLRLQINKGNAKEIQIAADLKTTTTTSPVILELSCEIDEKKSETIY